MARPACGHVPRHRKWIDGLPCNSVVYLQKCMETFMIPRTLFTKAVKFALANNPVCVLLGPRQCGKTTLARQLVKRQRSEEHTSELQSPCNLVCRLLLE